MSGSLDGYTDLHKACLENKLDYVTELVRNSKVDVNAVAADGAQPLVIAGLLGHLDIVKTLLKANANVDAKFGEEIQSKFVNDAIWCNDFGDKITLAIFAIINDKDQLMDTLNRVSTPNLKVISISNKTLLMYAIEKDNYRNAEAFRKIKDREFLNIRDNDGLSAIHYMVHKNKYGEFRYDQKQLMIEPFKAFTVGFLLWNGVDIHCMINDDPQTFLLNSAAYRGAYSIINRVLPYYTFITQSKALYYATLPMNDPEKYLRPDNGKSSLTDLDFNRGETIEMILKDLVNRRTFGFPVPEEEKRIMDELIATDTDLKGLIKHYEESFIYGSLKNTVFEYCEESITLFDFLMTVGASDKKLRYFVKEKSFFDEFLDYMNRFIDDIMEFDWVFTMYSRRIIDIQKRIKLLGKLKKVSILRKFIPLPYELVLDIIEYLNNYDLQNFINSFYENY